jgi:hypothetical protein
VIGAHSGVVSPRIGTITTQRMLRAAFGEEAFTNAQALEVGIGRRQLQSAITAGTVHRLSRGLFTAAAPDPRVALLALQRQWRDRGIDTVVGGRSAADIWGIPVVGRRGPSAPSRPTVWTAQGGVRAGARGAVHFVIGDVPDEHRRILVDGLIVTGPLRTAIDVVRLGRMRRVFALASLTAGIRRQWALDEGLGSDEEALITRGMHMPSVRQRYVDLLTLILDEVPAWGTRSVRDCLDALDPRIETALEALSWGRFIEAGIPLPIPQVWLQGSSGRWYRVDFWWPELRLIGEADGMGKYGEVAVLHSEKVRHLDLEGPGRTVLRWGWSHVIAGKDPLFEGLLAKIRSAAA